MKRPASALDGSLTPTPHPWSRVIPSAVSVVETMTATANKPWLVLGKGPSADHRHLWRLADFHVLTLNHASRVYPDAALHHFVDWEAFLECVPDMRPAAIAVLPWHPHVRNRPGKTALGHRLGEVSQRFGVLPNFATYNSSVMQARPDLPLLVLRAFSVTGAFAVLTAASIREIYSLGVDGGRGYAAGFDMKDHLSNGQPSFDAQTSHLRRILAKKSAKWYRLDADTTGPHSRFAVKGTTE